MSACIAGIGSRKTPQLILSLMMLLGEWCRENGVWVRSGHAPGADYAWECGALDHCIAYMPWPRFNTGSPFKTRNIIQWEEVLPEVRSRAIASIGEYHPNPYAVRKNDRTTKLMARNYFQMFGTQAVARPVNAVVCWTPGGKGGGGTGQALRIAKPRMIPVLDLGIKQNQDARVAKQWMTQFCLS